MARHGHGRDDDRAPARLEAGRAAIEADGIARGWRSTIAPLERRLAAGEPLAALGAELAGQLDSALSSSSALVRDGLLVMARFVESLRGRPERLGTLDGADFDSVAFEARLTPEFAALPALYHRLRAHAALLAGDFEASLAFAARARPYLPQDTWAPQNDDLLITALAAAGRHDQVRPEDRDPLLAALRDCWDGLRARTARTTCGPGLLVAAELARLEGRLPEATQAYERAVAAIAEGGSLYLLALACEAAARFHRLHGSASAAEAHLRRARDAYQGWGASAKVDALQTAHPDLRPGRTIPSPPREPAPGPSVAEGLDASQRLLRAVFDNAKAFIFVRALDGRILLANRHFRESHGISRDGDVALTYFDLFPRGVVEGMLASDRQVLATGTALERELTLPHLGGPLRTYLSIKCPLPGEDGAPNAVCVIATDITERKHAEEELRRYQDHLEELVTQRTADLTRAMRSLEQARVHLLHSDKMASVGQLASGVAHEINNPVAAICSNVAVLENYCRDLMDVLRAFEACEPALPAGLLSAVQAAKTRAQVDDLRGDISGLLADTKDGLRRVTGIIQTLRQFSRGDDEGWELTDLRHWIEWTLQALRGQLQDKADVVVQYGQIPPVECLPSQLIQVFSNFLVNAAQAIRGHGTITVRTSRFEREVWIEIEDSGEGIAPEHLPRIFDPFFTTRPAGTGAGLGLALCHRIVEHHHGRLEVESELGKGSRFRVWLPVRQPSSVTASGRETS